LYFYLFYVLCHSVGKVNVIPRLVQELFFKNSQRLYLQKLFLFLFKIKINLYETYILIWSCCNQMIRSYERMNQFIPVSFPDQILKLTLLLKDHYYMHRLYFYLSIYLFIVPN